MTGYKIIKEWSLEALEDAVKLALKDGWNPIGAPFATRWGDEGKYWYQAMGWWGKDAPA